MFQIGDYVVKPATGVCRVENILHLDLSKADKNRLYYLLIPSDHAGEKIYVPVDSSAIKIRKAMTKEEAEALIRKIPQIEETWIRNDKEREQQYKTVIRSGEPESLIGMFMSLYLRKMRRVESGKKNTTIDEHYYRQAENQLYAELGIALGKNQEDVFGLIAEACRA